jgi:hypothetical protein
MVGEARRFATAERGRDKHMAQCAPIVALHAAIPEKGRLGWLHDFKFLQSDFPLLRLTVVGHA